MEIILATSAGFCMGVRRAVDLALEASEGRGLAISTYGPLVHNPQVISLLDERGVRCERDIDNITEGRVILRSHGISPQEERVLADRDLDLVDATCPKVKRVQRIIREYADKGCTVVILGDPDHPEVRALVGYSDGKAVVVSGPDRIPDLDVSRPMCLVAQTTQHEAVFEQVSRELAARNPDVKVFHTICASTETRQREVAELARTVDLLIVIGGRESGNTRRLTQIGSALVRTVQIESERELDDLDFEGVQRVGVTAGASTPTWVIERVMDRLRLLDEAKSGGVLPFLRRIGRAIVVSSAFAALAAAMLAVAACVLLGVGEVGVFAMLAAMYVLSMHVLNRAAERRTASLRDEPVKADFYRRAGPWMIGVGLGSGLLALVLAASLGWQTLILAAACCLLGVLYSVKVIPRRWTGWLRYRRLKDIAASKNFFVALAWTLVTVVPPALAMDVAFMRALAVFVFVMIVVGLRSILLDLVDIAADGLLGRETIPTVLGERRTLVLLGFLALLCVIVLLIAGLSRILPPLAYGFALVLAIEALYAAFGGGVKIRSRVVREFLIDLHLVVAGLAALVWSVFTS